MTDTFSIDARGLRIRKALIALGEAVAAYTRSEFEEGASGRAGDGPRRAPA